MSYGICLKIWGDYACFTRPEMKAERVSYDVITPSSARGIIESIYWKPAIKWIIDKIHVINPIQFTNIRRNEISEKISFSSIAAIANGENKPFYIDTLEKRQQRASLILKDVCYCIEAHFELTDKAGANDDEKKHYNIALRRVKEGQYYQKPVLGTREFSANFEWIDTPLRSQLKGEIDLGFMLYDMTFLKGTTSKTNYQDIYPQFYRAQMINGVIDVQKCLKESQII